MTVRRATALDIPAMLVMGEKFHAHSNLSEIPYDAESFRRTVEIGLEQPGQAYFVTEADGRLTGMAAGLVYPSYFNHAATTGQEMFWWSEGHEGRLLKRALEDWAKEMGCVSFCMIALYDDNRESMDRLYRRDGYRPSENSYIKRF